MKFPCALKNALLIIRDHFGLSFATKGLSYLAALYLPLLLLARYKLSCYQTIGYRQFQCLQRIPCWKPLVISFCSSLGSAHLLIERTTIDPLYLWVIKTLFWRRCRGVNAFGEWNLVRKYLYYVLKFIVTCYYGK